MDVQMMHKIILVLIKKNVFLVVLKNLLFMTRIETIMNVKLMRYVLLIQIYIFQKEYAIVPVKTPQLIKIFMIQKKYVWMNAEKMK